MPSDRCQAFIARFLAQHDDRSIEPADILVDSFGDSPSMADRLLALVLAGTKTATCSSLWACEHEGMAPIEPGLLALILDGSGAPRCVLETVSVETMPFDRVPASFARAEGEHEPLDLPDEAVLEHWRTGHRAFYARTLPPLGISPTEGMPVVCERFRVIYREP